MRSKYLAVIMVWFVLFGMASAQEYSIRANRGLNLRAEPALNAPIADTVLSGSILQVVGEFNRWLKIDRGGRQVWLANWVNYSRIENVEPTGSQQATAPIDNCCYVDRQCQSDQEWIAGYWAYQNQQCVAPGQTQPTTPAQPVGSAPATVDNCCFVDRQCQSDKEWVDGYWAYQRNQCAARGPAPAISTPGRMPRIEGSDRFVRVIARSLNLLRDKAPEWYTYVISAIDTIAEIPKSQPAGGYCSAFAVVSSRRVEIESCFPSLDITFWSSPISMAGTLAHEACHIHTYEAGTVFPYGLAQEELECSKPAVAVYGVLDPQGRAVNLITDLAGVRRISNVFCQMGEQLACQQLEILHLYYD